MPQPDSACECFRPARLHRGLPDCTGCHPHRCRDDVDLRLATHSWLILMHALTKILLLAVTTALLHGSASAQYVRESGSMAVCAHAGELIAVEMLSEGPALTISSRLLGAGTLQQDQPQEVLWHGWLPGVRRGQDMGLDVAANGDWALAIEVDGGFTTSLFLWSGSGGLSHGEQKDAKRYSRRLEVRKVALAEGVAGRKVRSDRLQNLTDPFIIEWNERLFLIGGTSAVSTETGTFASWIWIAALDQVEEIIEGFRRLPKPDPPQIKLPPDLAALEHPIQIELKGHLVGLGEDARAVVLGGSLLISARLPSDRGGRHSEGSLQFYQAAHPARWEPVAPMSDVLSVSRTYDLCLDAGSPLVMSPPAASGPSRPRTVAHVFDQRSETWELDSRSPWDELVRSSSKSRKWLFPKQSGTAAPVKAVYFFRDGCLTTLEP